MIFTIVHHLQVVLPSWRTQLPVNNWRISFLFSSQIHRSSAVFLSSFFPRTSSFFSDQLLPFLQRRDGEATVARARWDPAAATRDGQLGGFVCLRVVAPTTSRGYNGHAGVTGLQHWGIRAVIALQRRWARASRLFVRKGQTLLSIELVAWCVH